MSNPVGFILTDEELHAADPCPHSMFDQQRLDYGRAVERLLLRKLRERPAVWTLKSGLDARETTCQGRLWFTDPQSHAWQALHIIPEDHE